jgi:magnesium-transporting ATPase (P-type)
MSRFVPVILLLLGLASAFNDQWVDVSVYVAALLVCVYATYLTGLQLYYQNRLLQKLEAMHATEVQKQISNLKQHAQS